MLVGVIRNAWRRRSRKRGEADYSVRFCFHCNFVFPLLTCALRSTATIFRKEYDDMTSKSFLPRSKKEVRDAGLSSTYGRRTLADPKASYDMSLEELKQGDSSIWKSKYM
jgi:hypothetical protein